MNGIEVVSCQYCENLMKAPLSKEQTSGFVFKGKLYPMCEDCAKTAFEMLGLEDEAQQEEG